MSIYTIRAKRKYATMLLVASLYVPQRVSAAEDELAAGVFRQHCATCHEAPNIPRIPSVTALRQMASRNILRALETGSMREQGLQLGRSERTAVANWLGTKVAIVSSQDDLSNRCQDRRHGRGLMHLVGTSGVPIFRTVDFKQLTPQAWRQRKYPI